MTIFLILVALIAVTAIIFYNRLVRGRFLVGEGWSGIDVQLKRRAELIPNLVEAVKAYKAYESGTLEKVTQLRNQAVSTQGVAARGDTEKQLSGVLGNIFAIAENYPDLKANQSFGDLQQQLIDTEDQLQYARRYYNGAVRDMNIKVQSFPGNIIANAFGFKKMEYFQLDSDTERSVPKVTLS